jgi:hypothetical protein
VVAAVVAGMSVQPTSEKVTLSQAAKAEVAPRHSAIAVAVVFIISLSLRFYAVLLTVQSITQNFASESNTFESPEIYLPYAEQTR